MNVKLTPKCAPAEAEWETLTITMTDGEVITFNGPDWDDYTVALGANVPSVVVKLKGAWVGIFPLAHIKHVMMK